MHSPADTIPSIVFSFLKEALKNFTHCRTVVCGTLCGALFFILFTVESVFAQNAASVDSLRKILATTSLEHRAAVLNNLARAYRYLSPDSSLLYAMQARALAKQCKDNSALAYSLLNIGLVFENQGRYDFALDNVFQALKLFESDDDNAGRASCLNLIGLVYKAQDKNVQALEYHQKSLVLYQSLNNTERIATVLANIGATYQAERRYSEALANLERSATLYQSLNDPNIFWSWFNMALVYQHQQRYTEALTYHRQALPLARKLRNHRFEAALLCNIGLCAMHQHQFDSALSWVHESVRIASENTFRNELKNSYKALSEVYTVMGNDKAALEQYQRYTDLKDLILSAEMQHNIADLQTRVETEHQEREISVLSVLRNSLIAGSALLLLLVALLINRYRHKRTSEALLKELNEALTRQQRIVEDQAAEIELANTELQQFNDALALKNYELAELNIEKNDFLGMVAHDLKNPLSNMRLLAKLLNERAEALSPAEIHEFSGDMRTLTEQMFALVTNLLDVNAIEQGKMNVAIMPFDLPQLVDMVVRHYRPQSEEKQITIHVETSGDSLIASADKNFTMEILENLLSNAIKYSPPKKNVFIRVLDDGNSTTPERDIGQEGDGKTLQRLKSPTVAHHARLVRVEIQDEGPGLSENDQLKLFKKFTRLTAQPTAGEHSSGLGLSIVKKMVEAMSGNVWCESELGRGATFIVELPAQI